MATYSTRFRILSLCVLFLIGCGGERNTPPDPYGLTATLHDVPAERIWQELDAEKIGSISEGDSYIVYNPTTIKADDGDFLSVYDTGNNTLKTFTAEGEHLATYGAGEGRAPGQVLVLTDAGVWRDSLVYLVDPRQRRVSFFNKNGDFVKTEDYDLPVYRVHWAADSIKYDIPPAPLPGTPFMRIGTPEGTQDISRPPVWVEESFMLDGSLHTAGRKAIYVPKYIPVILTYSPDDTTGTAYPTPDYGRELPNPREGEFLNQKATLSGGILSVFNPSLEGEGVAFDLYSANPIKYLRSVRFRIEDATGLTENVLYAHGQKVLAAARDTTVDLYRVLPSTE